MTSAEHKTSPWTRVAFWVTGMSFSAILAVMLSSVGLEEWGLAPVGIGVACAIAAVTDSTLHRIPNALTYPIIVLGLCLNLVASVLDFSDVETIHAWLQAPGALSGLLGFLTCAVVGLVAFVGGGLGGGDVKLAAATGATLGLGECVDVLTVALAVATAMSLLNLMLRGRFVSWLQVAGLSVVTALTTSSRLNLPVGSTSEIPLAPALLVGLLASPYIEVTAWLSAA